MKKATVFAAALALLLSLAACGNQGSNGGQTNNGQTNSGENNGSLTDQNGGTNNGTDGQTTRSWTGTGSYNGGAGSQTGTRGTVGNDLRRAADGVGRAVEDAVDDGRDMLSRTASATTFERMLDNARVHDTDGVLTDGENSRW